MRTLLGSHWPEADWLGFGRMGIFHPPTNNSALACDLWKLLHLCEPSENVCSVWATVNFKSHHFHRRDASPFLWFLAFRWLEWFRSHVLAWLLLAVLTLCGLVRYLPIFFLYKFSSAPNVLACLSNITRPFPGTPAILTTKSINLYTV